MFKKAKIKEELIKFISDWTSHNKNLQASFSCLMDLLLLDLTKPQNASFFIDALMNLIQILKGV